MAETSLMAAKWHWEAVYSVCLIPMESDGEIHPIRKLQFSQ